MPTRQKFDDEFISWYFDNIPVWYLDFAYKLYQDWKEYDNELLRDFDRQFGYKVITLEQVKQILSKLPEEK